MPATRLKDALAKYQSISSDQLAQKQAVPPQKNRRVSSPGQLRALHLATKFSDQNRKLIYLSLCKNIHPTIIDLAESFVSDAAARNKGALFMWKIKQIKLEWQKAGKNWKNPLKPKKSPKSSKQKTQAQPTSLRVK